MVRRKTVWTMFFLVCASLSIAHANAQDAATPASAAGTPALPVASHAAISLTPSERRWLAALPPLRVTFDERFPPFTRGSASGEPKGIAGDYLHELISQLGLRVVYVHSDNLEHTLRMVADGKVDMIMAFNPAGRAGQGLVFSKPYIEFPLVIATRDDTRSISGIDDLEGYRLAANLNRESVLKLLEQATVKPETITVPDTDTGLRWLAEGKVDATVGNLAAVDYLIRTNYPHLRIGAPANLREPLAFAVSSRFAPLVPLMDRVLDHVSEREHERIRNTWLSVNYTYGGSWQSILRKVLPFALLTLLALIAITYAYVRLHRETRRRLRSEEQLSDVTRNLPAIVYRFHYNTAEVVKFVYVDGDPESIFGLTAEEIIADEPRAFSTIAEEDRPRLKAAVKHAANTLEPLHVTVRVRANGRETWVTTHGLPRHNDDGLTEFNGYWIDVTTQYLQAEALAVARDAAESATRAKTEFLATMSHEIRTPMNGVLGMLELLHDTPLEEEQRSLLSIAGDSAGALLQILDDVLDFSKIEAGRLTLEEIPVDLRTLIDGAVTVLAAQAHDKDLELNVAVDVATAAIVLADDVRLRQVVLNLVSNAIKFTEQGKVTVTVAVLEDFGDRQHLRLTVADTGIGIDADKLVELFTPFTQAEASTSRRFGGTGLGLVICRRLIDLMRGRIALESKPGDGTTAIVELTVTVHERERFRASLHGHRVAVQLRENADRVVLGDFVQACGMTVVDTAQDADLVFTDDAPWLAEPCPTTTIGVTHEPNARGYHLRDDRPVLTLNPLRWTILPLICERALGLRQHVLAPTSRKYTRKAPPRKHALAQGTLLLVADDNATNRTLIRVQLDKLGLACDLVGDGAEALQAMKARRYALVIADCHMPVMDGYTLAQQWRAQECPQQPRLPIIAMTANALSDEPARCRDAGMDAFLAKPTNLRTLEMTLQRWLPELLVTHTPAPVDMPTLIENFGDTATIATIVSELLRVTRVELAEIELRLATVEGRELQAWLHRTMGGMHVFGHPSVVVAGDQLERDIGSFDDAYAREAFAHYAVELKVFLDALDAWLASMVS